MRWSGRLFVGALVAGISTPAIADGLYLRFQGGGALVPDGMVSGTDFSAGYIGTAAVGYSIFFPESIADLRLELEGSYRRNDFDDVTVVGTTVDADGDLTAMAAMANVYFDFRTIWSVVPYLGVGAGVAEVAWNDFDSALSVAVDDEDTVAALQTMVGFDYNLSDSLAIGVEYRFFFTDDPTLTDALGFAFDTSYENHSVLVGFRMTF